MIAPKEITLTIDGKKCVGREGQTILEIARAHDIYIPTLCYLKHLSPWGGCRMCIVEVAGNPKVVPSCATPATDGSVVTTKSDRLVRLRKMTLELLFSERNHICPICPYNKGDCGLQHQAYIHGLDRISLPYLYPALPVDVSGRFFGIDHNRCILCTRCVRACDEMEGVHTLDIANRGEKNRVVVDGLASFGTSDTCTSCGACVANCPTGALFDKYAVFLGQITKSDQVRTTCQECPVGCGLLVYTKDRRLVNVHGDFDSPINRGHLCVKGRYETWSVPRSRITQPLLRRNGRRTPVSWDEALQFIRQHAAQTPREQKGLLLSPRITNETVAALAKLAGQFDRMAVAVARHEAALCSPDLLTSSSSETSALDALHDADAIIVLGAQPSRDNGVVAAKIRTSARKRGAKLLLFYTRKSDLDYYAHLAAAEVSLERAFWKRVGTLLAHVKRPVLVYGPAAMSPIGITVMEKLIEVLEKVRGGQALRTVALPVSTNTAALTAAHVEPLEEIAPWLDRQPLNYLHVVASDEPDGGARWLEQKHVPALLEQIECVAVQAAYQSALTDRAHVVLPTLTWAEKTGTITNFEGRQLPVRPVLPAAGAARDDRAILESLFA